VFFSREAHIFFTSSPPTNLLMRPTWIQDKADWRALFLERPSIRQHNCRDVAG
jgi:hypothetical protein